MLWLNVSIASSFFAYSWTALTRAESGSWIEEAEIGFAGPEASDCWSSNSTFLGTAVQP